MKYKFNEVLYNTLKEAEEAKLVMLTTKITKIENLFVVSNGIEEWRFDNEKKANLKKNELDNKDYSNLVIEEVPDIEVDYNSLLKESLQFGQQLINTFLLDNWTSPISINVEQSVLLLNKFEVIIKLCNLGDIKNVKVLLENTQVDEIFTQERKDKYLEQIKIYLTR